MPTPLGIVFSRDELDYLYTEQRLSVGAIGQRFGCSRVPIRDALRRFGIPVRRGGNSKGCKLPLRCEIDADELRRLYEVERWSSDRLAEHFGCADTTILKRLKAAGVRVRHHNETKRGRTNHLRLPIDDDAIVAAYLSPERPSYEELGVRFGCRGATIRYRLVQRGVPLRTLSETIAGKRYGRANPNWREDLTPEERSTRRDMSQQAKWRAKVYARDGYRCQCCGDARGKNLNAHHVESHSTNREVRFDPDNGVTLCVRCHRAFHSAYGQKHNNRVQLDAFIAEFSQIVSEAA